MQLDDIKKAIEAHLDGAEVEVLDPRNDGVHLGAVIKYAGFEGKTRIAQHRMVYAALGNAFSTDEIHALQISTGLPE